MHNVLKGSREKDKSACRAGSSTGAWMQLHPLHFSYPFHSCSTHTLKNSFLGETAAFLFGHH